MQSNVITESINRSADDPSVSVHLPIPLAISLIHLVGGDSRIAGRRNDVQWFFPDGFWTWSCDEAVRYALEVAPDLLEAA